MLKDHRTGRLSREHAYLGAVPDLPFKSFVVVTLVESVLDTLPGRLIQIHSASGGPAGAVRLLRLPGDESPQVPSQVPAHLHTLPVLHTKQTLKRV